MKLTDRFWKWWTGGTKLDSIEKLDLRKSTAERLLASCGHMKGFHYVIMRNGRSICMDCYQKEMREA
jgi:hypothetical protein